TEFYRCHHRAWRRGKKARWNRKVGTPDPRRRESWNPWEGTVVVRSRVQVVCVLEPPFHFGVDSGERFDWDPVRDPVLLFESSSFDQPAGGLHITQGKAQVDTARGRRLDFGEDMLAIDWNDRLARADFHVRAQPAGHLEDLLKDRPDPGSLAFEHCLHIAFGRFEIG